MKSVSIFPELAYTKEENSSMMSDSTVMEELISSISDWSSEILVMKSMPSSPVSLQTALN